MQETHTPGPIQRYLEADHRLLDDLLARATAETPIDLDVYAEFRKRLLRHIGLEEKILLTAAQAANGGKPLEEAATLRLQHGAIAALLVPPPKPVIVKALRSILTIHNDIEEGPHGLYAHCEQLLTATADEVLVRLETAPEVRVNPHVDSPLAFNAAQRALARANLAELYEET